MHSGFWIPGIFPGAVTPKLCKKIFLQFHNTGRALNKSFFAWILGASWLNRQNLLIIAKLKERVSENQKHKHVERENVDKMTVKKESGKIGKLFNGITARFTGQLENVFYRFVNLQQR